MVNQFGAISCEVYQFGVYQQLGMTISLSVTVRGYQFEVYQFGVSDQFRIYQFAKTEN